MEVALRYGRLMKRLDMRSFDAEMFFAGPFILGFTILGYILWGYTMLVQSSFGVVSSVLAQFLSVSSLLMLLLIGVGLAYSVKPRKMGNVKWLPFVYLYWTVQIFVALYAMGLILFRRPRRWRKTTRTGVVTNVTAK